jgi:hypothetical protein
MITMSEIMLTLRDKDRAIRNTVHISDAGRMVAALEDEPESLAELAVAVRRFMWREPQEEAFRGYWQGPGHEPWDAGIMVIDMAARVIACESEACVPCRTAGVQYHDGKAATDIWLHYQLPEDWLLINSLEQWEAVASKRKAERLAMPALDVRSILNPAINEFIVRECQAARQAGETDPVAALHAKWLLTPRDDLRGQSPRELLLAKMEHISSGCEARALLWSFTGERPDGLSHSTAAYQYGLFGVHENVVYYDLLRHLLGACWQRVTTGKAGEVRNEVAHLERLREEWLNAPNEEYDGLAPSAIIELERQRLPIARSPEHAVVDPDCPLCQMMAEHSGPMFWHLDGSHMDYEFVFSFFRTRQEWEEDQRAWEAFNRKFERQQKKRAKTRAGAKSKQKAKSAGKNAIM